MARDRRVYGLREMLAMEEDLMIGPVQCRACKTVWNAPAPRKAVFKLECPQCGAQNSLPEGIHTKKPSFWNPLQTLFKQKRHRPMTQ